MNKRRLARIGKVRQHAAVSKGYSEERPSMAAEMAVIHAHLGTGCIQPKDARRTLPWDDRPADAPRVMERLQ